MATRNSAIYRSKVIIAYVIFFHKKASFFWIFCEFVVISLKTYGDSLISTCSTFNDNNNNNNIEYDIKRSSGIYTASKQRKVRTKTR